MTDASIGFDTAIGIATAAGDRLTSTAHSHYRIIAAEIMGHRTGWPTLGAGLAGGAEAILIREIPYAIVFPRACSPLSATADQLCIRDASESALLRNCGGTVTPRQKLHGAPHSLLTSPTLRVKREPMKFICLFLSAILLAGCSGTHRKGVSRYDQFDATKVDQMVGNNVSHAPLQKTVVCLNARRETRKVTAVTNVMVTPLTNQLVQAITNQTISISTNYLFTLMTNLSPALPPVAIQPVGDSAGAAAETNTNTVAVVTNLAPAITTNVQVSLARNQSATTAPNQATANNQLVRTYNNQITTASNNLSISMMTNQIVTAETNQVVSYVTNTSVISVTNVAIAPTNSFAHDYFLYTELTPPPDFTLQTGESLVLLVDGVRYGFTQGQSGTAFVARKGYTSGLYRVPPEVLVAIANAKEVKIRFKGVNSVIERTMSGTSKQHFRGFLVKYFTSETAPSAPKSKTASLEEPAHVATR